MRVHSWLAAALVAFAAVPSVSAQEVLTGTTGEGALYELAVPADWNGELVVYAHGIVDPGLPVMLPSDTDQDAFLALRGALLAGGYAVASTSFSENGYAIKDGARRVHQLSGLFTSRVARPARTYLVGHSLGGAIVQSLAERFPSQYDGALALCGLLGGSVPEVQYVGDARVLFDRLFPEVLAARGIPVFPTTTFEFAPGTELFDLVLGALIGGLAPAEGFRTIQFAIGAGLPPFDLPAEAPLLLDAAVRVIGFNLRFSADLLERTHGRTPYQGAGIEATPDALNYVQKYYTPTGNLRIPMLALHTDRDPLVPVFHEAIYAAVVAEAGASANLRQRMVERYGHCTFAEAEVLAAFDELTAWVAAAP